jgi:murein DD-endopeptidase MepM/ murein hydrolase activator NlpD
MTGGGKDAAAVENILRGLEKDPTKVKGLSASNLIKAVTSLGGGDFDKGAALAATEEGAALLREEFEKLLKVTTELGSAASLAVDGIDAFDTKMSDALSSITSRFETYGTDYKSLMGFNAEQTPFFGMASAAGSLRGVAGYQTSKDVSSLVGSGNNSVSSFNTWAEEIKKAYADAMAGGRTSEALGIVESDGVAIQERVAGVLEKLLQGASALMDNYQQQYNLKFQSAMYGGPGGFGVMAYKKYGEKVGTPGIKNSLSRAKSFAASNNKEAMAVDRLNDPDAYYKLVAMYDAGWQAIDTIVQAETDLANKRAERLQKEKELADLFLNGLKAYLSAMQTMKKANSQQVYLMYKRIAAYAKTPEEKLQSQVDVFQAQRDVMSERYDYAEAWLSHQSATGRISTDSLIKAWEQVLALAKKDNNEEMIWKAEEQIYNLQKEKAEKISENLARNIFKRAAGLSGPLAIGIAEYRAALGEGTGKLDEEITDAGDILAEFAADTKKKVGGLTTDITGNIDKLWAGAVAYANSLKNQQIAQDAANNSTAAAQAALAKYAPQQQKLADIIGGMVDPASKLAGELGNILTRLQEMFGWASGVTKEQAEWRDYRAGERAPAGASTTSILSNLTKGLPDIGKIIAQAVLAGTAAANKYNGMGMNGVPTGGGGGATSSSIPVPGGTYSDTWGAPRSGGRKHKGTDIFAKRGTAVFSVIAGTADVKTGGLGGRVVYVSGVGGRTYNAHLDQQLVKRGQKISYGQLIGTVGDTGNAKGGAPHLHFQYAPKGGQGWVNPYPWLRKWQGKTKVAHSGALGGTDETFYTLMQKGEAVIPKQEVPLLFNILNKLNDSTFGGGGATLNLELNLQLPDGRTVSMNETVTGISGTKVKIERKIP